MYLEADADKCDTDIWTDMDAGEGCERAVPAADGGDVVPGVAGQGAGKLGVSRAGRGRLGS